MFSAQNADGMIVRPDGSAAQGVELPDGLPFLHLLPKLWLPYPKLAVTTPQAVMLESLSIPELDWKCEEGFNACRPYPNWKYVVFGHGRRMGVLIQLKEQLPKQITVEALYVLSGEFCTSMSGSYMEVRHTQHLSVTRSEVGVDCYSTEGLLPTVVCGEEYRRVFAERYGPQVEDIGHPVVDEDGYLADEWLLVMNERLEPLSNHFLCCDDFEDYEPHHAKVQIVGLSRFNEEHRSNAMIEMPQDVFVEAVRLAGEPLAEGSLPEQHVALRMLCDWWNFQSEVPEEYRCARTARVLVRFRDENEYQDVDLEVPPSPITTFQGDAGAAARVGDHLLIIFLKGQDDVWEDDTGSHYPKVDGDIYETIGAPKDVFPIGAGTLDGLRTFVTAYPDIHRYLAAAKSND